MQPGRWQQSHLPLLHPVTYHEQFMHDGSICLLKVPDVNSGWAGESWWSTSVERAPGLVYCINCLHGHY